MSEFIPPAGAIVSTSEEQIGFTAPPGAIVSSSEPSQQPEVVSQEASFDSPYLKDRKFGEFVTGRSMPVEVEDLSEEDKVKADKAIKQIESNKIN